MDEITRIRSRIDEIDQHIIQLFKDRFENAKYLGQLKQRKGIQTRDLKREREILLKVQSTATKLGLDRKFVSEIFRGIFKLAIDAQEKPYVERLKGKRVLIIGGTKGIGRFFARFTRLNGATVTITSRNRHRTRKAATELDVTPGSTSDLTSSDIVIIAVPIRDIEQTSVKAATQMRSGTLLIDLSSVKSRIADNIARAIPKNIEYVSLHPLFGPEVDHLNGQNLVAINYKSGGLWKIFQSALRDAGGNITFTTSKQHDKTMAFVQVTHHFAILILAGNLHGWSGEMKTTSIRRTIQAIRRLLRNWDTVYGIQQFNPYAGTARSQFANLSRKMTKTSTRSWDGLHESLSLDVQKWGRKL